MSLTRKTLPVVVFALSLTVTIISRKSTSPAPVRTPTAESVTEKSPVHPTKAVRAEKTSAAVRASLRAGKIDEAHVLLRQLASADPVAFFKLIGKLPGLPGVEDLIRDAAAQLPWDDAKIIALLNNISNNDLRDIAWAAYIKPKAGVLPDGEVFKVGIQADANFALIPLYADAANKRPDAFLDFLNTLNKTTLRVEFFSELMKVHPERASELFHRIPDEAGGSVYDKAYILQARLYAQPTTENLQAVLRDRGSNGIYDGNLSSSLVGSAYPGANASERVKMLAWVGSLPPLARNRLLDGMVFTSADHYTDPISPAELSEVLNTYTSTYRQEIALKSWLNRNKDWDQKNPGWINQLPNGRLRNQALELREKSEKR
ncbi:hypothetical protein JIN84_20625 [Luteolibacter yonseiensis]|uniref:Uncharacterized protein n=1 Tax=Luteolibacter yonseiensis TaxID=1144680 RepID=A0A934R9N1_9BACT|nr:hypothetical protein [Luteolibacter yonseiensis]MBK1818040.1 hypothetical protein [Luteolibacter yonseiensis]